MARTAHVIGNGRSASLYEPAKGFKLTCNLPGFSVDDVYTTCIVDFKMMKAIAEGSVTIPGEWVLGARPKAFCQGNPDFYLRHAGQVKEFFVDLPQYAGNYTNFNCGHMAVFYAIKRLAVDEINMYGFDSMFAQDLSSTTDFFLVSDRDPANNLRLTNNWRPIWQSMFKEHPHVTFKVHSRSSTIQFPVSSNVEVVVH